MLQKLQIKNYAIIEEIGIGFSPGLNVITGETGAGKSILMGALSMILGDRADGSVLLDQNKKCVVEGVFSLEKRKEVTAFLQEHELDGDEEIVIRREIASNGKSRAFINDTPVILSLLKKLSSLLVNLHQQFDELELGESGFQREVLDAFSGHHELLNDYQFIFRKYVAVKKNWASLMDQKNQFNKEYDYHQFLFNELHDASFIDDELEGLDAEMKMLSNAENIKSSLTKVYYELTQGELPAVQQLKLAILQLQSIEKYHPGLSSLLERLRSAQIEIRDIAGELESINDHVQLDASRVDQINERIAVGYKLLKKHGVKTTAELKTIQLDLEKKLKEVLDMDEKIAALENQANALYGDAQRLAVILSSNRQLQIKIIEEKVNQLLGRVGMPSARLKAEQHITELNEFGMDSIEFLFDANKSDRFEPVRKVASGGELSRLMLCIKSLVAQSIDLPTLIFDEIDSGISGEAAKQVGIILLGLAQKRQVICITHQAQIAGKGDTHYFVYKDEQGGSIKTNIRLLKPEERIKAIAKMLSGENPTAASMENAREMILRQ
jgi:DNA repair protein RecN (Recombination protein N)